MIESHVLICFEYKRFDSETWFGFGFD